MGSPLLLHTFCSSYIGNGIIYEYNVISKISLAKDFLIKKPCQLIIGVYMCTRDFKEEVVAALEAKPYQRVIHLVYDGQDYFIKRKLAGRREWLKGSSELTFLREFHKIQVVNSLLDLAPEIVDFGSNYFVLKGAGFALDSTYSDVEKDWTPVYSLIGSALADLHSHKLAHGRPALRDFCYDPDKNKITLLDWENGEKYNSFISPQVLDLFLFIHGFQRQSQQEHPHYLDAAMDAYKENPQSQEVVKDLKSFANKYKWTAAITRLGYSWNKTDLNAYTDTIDYILKKL